MNNLSFGRSRYLHTTDKGELVPALWAAEPSFPCLLCSTQLCPQHTGSYKLVPCGRLCFYHGSSGSLARAGLQVTLAGQGHLTGMTFFISHNHSPVELFFFCFTTELTAIYRNWIVQSLDLWQSPGDNLKPKPVPSRLALYQHLLCSTKAENHVYPWGKKVSASKLRGEIHKRSLYLKTARRLTKGNNFSVISVSMAAGGFV